MTLADCPPCVSKEPEPVLRRIEEGLGDLKIFWRSSRIRKMRNMHHGRSGFPRPSTQNILISTKSTVVCLRENGACLLLLGRDGKRQYEHSAHTTRTIRKSLFQRASYTTFDYISKNPIPFPFRNIQFVRHISQCKSMSDSQLSDLYSQYRPL